VTWLKTAKRLPFLRNNLKAGHADKSMPATETEGSRILERQNALQTSQVLFRRIRVSPAMVLPFKDSEGGTCSYSILIGVTSTGTRQRKSKRSMLIAPRHLPLIKISVPPLARPLNPAVPRLALSNCRIPLVGLRRGLARGKPCI
jgi:hypothetical protein